MINYKNVIPVSKQLFYPMNKSIDIRTTIDDISNYRDIQYPYIGMLFYAKNQDTYYKVQSLSPGYLIYADNIINSNQPESGEEYVDYEIVPNCYIDKYTQLIDLDAISSSDLISINITSPTIVTENTIKFTNTDSIELSIGSIIKYIGNDINITNNVITITLYNGNICKVIEIVDNAVTLEILDEIVFSRTSYKSIIDRIEALENAEKIIDKVISE